MKYLLQPMVRWQFWLIVALLVKFSLFFFFIGESGPVTDMDYQDFLGRWGGDSSTYIDPIEHLIHHGTYEPDFRMPGYGAIYYPFFLLFGKIAGLNILIFIQCICSALSVYALALVSAKITKVKGIFYWVFYGYLLTTFVSIYDIYILTESLTTSFTIFALYYFVRYLEADKLKHLLFFAVLFTWMTFMRQIYLPLYAVFGFILIVHLWKRKSSLKKMAGTLLLFVAPWIVGEAFWVNHYYHQHGEIRISQERFSRGLESKPEFAIAKFVISWGGNCIYWDPSSEIRYFGVGSEREGPIVDPNARIPEHIYTSAFQGDSLAKIKEMFFAFKAESDTVKRQAIGSEIIRKMDGYTQSIKDENPMLYHVKSRISLYKIALIHSGTSFHFSTPAEELAWYKYLFKMGQGMLYILVVLIGHIALLYTLFKAWKHKDLLLLIIPVLAGYGLLLYPIILRAAESRYFVPSFPFMLVGVGLVFAEITNYIFKRKNARNDS